MKLKRLPVFRFTSVFAVIFAAIIIFTGCAFSTTHWVKTTIEKNYFRVDGDYSSISNLGGLSIDEMVSKLDKYSAFYSADEYAAVTADNEGSKSGIGVSFVFSEGEGVVLYSVIGNSPAKKAGLKAGDVLVAGSANGVSVQFAESNDFTSFITARSTGENFNLYLKNGEAVSLSKAEYTASYASMYTYDAAYDIEYSGKTRVVKESKGEGIAQLPEGVAYVYLSQFYGYAGDEVGELIKIFNTQNCTSLILDLRGNGGGFVDLMSQIGGRFTSTVVSGKAVSMRAKYRDGHEDTEHCYIYAQGVVPAGTNVYVMANHNTASASEALIGVLVSYGILKYENIFLSQYAGYEAKSYGKGIMQRTFEFYTGEALKLTVAGIYWADGTTIHDRGITVADGCVAAPASDDIVNVGYDDELMPVIDKILADRQQQN